MKSITTLMNVNTRVGPGTVYDKKTQVRRGTTIEYDQTLKDAANVIWYHTNKGWISGRFVSNAKDIKNKVKSEDKIMNLQNFDESDDEGEGSWAEFRKNEDRITDSLSNVADSGTSVATSGDDIVLSKKIFGLPYQWLRDTDVPLNTLYGKSLNDGELGYNYYEALMETPILSVIPGLPDFLPDASEEEKKSMTEYMDNLIKDIANLPGDFGKRVLEASTPDATTRLFSFKTCYSRFARYFNTLCQMNAMLMGLGNEVLPGFPDSEDYQFRTFNWAAYTIANKYVGRCTNDQRMTDPSQLFDVSGTIHKAEDIAGRIMDQVSGGNQETGEAAQIKTINDQYYTDFVINPKIGYSDELTNQAGTSMIANLFSGAQDMTKEIRFILDAAPGMTQGASSLSEEAGKKIKGLGDSATGVLGDVIKSISSSASTIVSGANLIFPEIWKASSYQRNFNIEIKLSTPYGTPRNIFLDILVPTWFWVCLAAPRQADVNSYMSPFLVRCHVPGIFSVNNGLVTALSIRKGGDDSAWSVDGFPLEVILSIQIMDLYHELSISSLNGIATQDAYNFMWNDTLIDYISVQSGLNMKVHDMGLKAAVAANLLSEVPQNLIHRWPDMAKERIDMFLSGMRY